MLLKCTESWLLWVCLDLLCSATSVETLQRFANVPQLCYCFHLRLGARIAQPYQGLCPNAARLVPFRAHTCMLVLLGIVPINAANVITSMAVL